MNNHLILEDVLLSTSTELTTDTTISFMMYDTVTVARFYLNVSTPLTVSKNDITCYNSNDGVIGV